MTTIRYGDRGLEEAEGPAAIVAVAEAVAIRNEAHDADAGDNDASHDRDKCAVKSYDGPWAGPKIRLAARRTAVRTRPLHTVRYTGSRPKGHQFSSL